MNIYICKSKSKADEGIAKAHFKNVALDTASYESKI